MTTDEESPDEPTSNEGVDISEDFQKECYELLDGASKDELNYICSKANSQLDELRKADMKQFKEFSTDNMPSSDY